MVGCGNQYLRMERRQHKSLCDGYGSDINTDADAHQNADTGSGHINPDPYPYQNTNQDSYADPDSYPYTRWSHPSCMPGRIVRGSIWIGDQHM